MSTSELSTTPILGNTTTFYVTRHSDYTSTSSTQYTFSVSTSLGNVTIPQLGGTLTLQGRDSKIHVTDYNVGGINLVYSSADVYTQSRIGDKRVLLLYGLTGETHELALPSALGQPTIEGDAATVRVETIGAAAVVQWDVTETRKVLHYGDDLDVYLLWRNDAFQYWVLQLEAPPPVSNYSSSTKETVVARAGYLLRSAAKTGTILYLTGDLNSTAELEIVAGPPETSSVYFNGDELPCARSSDGRLSSTLEYSRPQVQLPDLSSLEWRYVDSLPEVRDGYDDSQWVRADHETTNNTARDDNGVLFSLKTPTSLIAGDYGFSAGSLLYRGSFTSEGNESSLHLSTSGGSGFGHSVWINSTYIGSYEGSGSAKSYNQTLSLGGAGLTLERGRPYVITVLIDHMGQETSWTPGYDTMKTPRGIIDYELAGRIQADVSWKITGNLGGEKYADRLRGPFNEGGMWAERQGFHLPAPPTSDWQVISPFDGTGTAGVGLYAASFDLAVPAGWDVPMSFVFANTTGSDGSPSQYRVQLYVNGWQFGKYG